MKQNPKKLEVHFSDHDKQIYSYRYLAQKKKIVILKIFTPDIDCIYLRQNPLVHITWSSHHGVKDPGVTWHPVRPFTCQLILVDTHAMTLAIYDILFDSKIISICGYELEIKVPSNLGHFSESWNL